MAPTFLLNNQGPLSCLSCIDFKFCSHWVAGLHVFLFAVLAVALTSLRSGYTTNPGSCLWSLRANAATRAAILSSRAPSHASPLSFLIRGALQVLQRFMVVRPSLGKQSVLIQLCILGLWCSAWHAAANWREIMVHLRPALRSTQWSRSHAEHGTRIRTG